MRGTPSCRTTSACLPISRRTWQQASADPTASPSGRACDVSTNRSRCPICRNTSSSISLRLLTSLFCALEQFFHTGLRLFGSIQPEIQFGRTPDAQPLYQFVADIFACRLEPLYTPVSFGVITLNVDPNFGGPAIVGNVDRRHTYQANTGVGQFAFHQSFYLLAKGLPNPSAMVLQPTLLHNPPQVKRLRISENWMPVLCQAALRWRYCVRFPLSRLSTEVTAV